MFIINAAEDGQPKGTVQIEGPVINPKTGDIDENGKRIWPENSDKKKPPTMGAAMKSSIDNWPKFVSNNRHRFQDAGIVHHWFYIDFTYSGEHEDAIAARADISRQKHEEMEAKAQRNLEKRERKQEHDYSGDENVEDEKYEEENYRGVEQIIPEWIEPYEWTKPIKAAGWYQMCVTADNDIDVEMDIRSSADLGGIDRETGHVYTYDDREEIDEEERLMGPTVEEEEAKLVAVELGKALQNQVRDYDIDATRELVKEVNSLVSELQKKQSTVHNRIKGHGGDARRNHKKIVRSGIIETVLYLAITLFQIYTMRKWLLGNTVLG